MKIYYVSLLLTVNIIFNSQEISANNFKSDNMNISTNQSSWDKNALTWDRAMEEGSLFQKNIVEPSTLQFLNIQSGQKVLDLACGNGQMSRVMARKGAKVIAVDGSSEMIKLALKRSQGLSIQYQVVNLLSSEAFKQFEGQQFDAVLCNMALMDFTEIEPIFKLAHKALKQGGVFVFSITHPCFDKTVGPHLTEIHEEEGQLQQKHFIKVQHYLNSRTLVAKALPHLPVTHFHFHRSLETYLNAAFKMGFILSGFREPAFDLKPKFQEHKGWHHLSEIPVILVVKLVKL